MSRTIIEHLAHFATATAFEDLPDAVVTDSKHVLLDGLGCCLAGLDADKGRIGAQVGPELGGAEGSCTIFGTRHRSSAMGAAFANAESMNALDFDSVLPPGHVAPYVLPGIAALGESSDIGGRRLIGAIAVSHEISNRFGRAMDNYRTQGENGMVVPDVLGFASTIFGATAGAAIVKGCDEELTADALGISAAISPVNSYRSWMANVPNSSIKYTMPGPVAAASLMAMWSALFGHSGDRRVLDDAALGYRRFIGSTTWKPDVLLDGLGQNWIFPTQHHYKPYPHCRVMHSPLDALRGLVEEHGIRPADIEGIRCWGEAWVEQPLWMNRDVHRPHQAQFSIAHGLAVAAHMLPPGKQWQTPETLHDPSVLRLMELVSFAPHPDYVNAFAKDPMARPARVEIDARGETFAAERSYPRGTPTTDPAYAMTTADLVEKFRRNATDVLADSQTEALVQGILGLEAVHSVHDLLRNAAQCRET